MRIACFVAALLLPAVCLSAPLALPNSSFETDDDGDGIPDGWRLSRVGELGTAELDDTQATDGKRSVKLIGESPQTRLFLEAPRVEVEPGREYLFECRLKSEGVTAGYPVIGFARWTADGKWDDWSYAFKAPVNRDWQLCRQVFSIPPSTRYAAVRVWIEYFQGTAWFDDVKVSEYEPAEPGFVEDLSDTSAWRVEGGRVEQAEGGAKLVSEKQRDLETLFPLASMRRSLPAEAAEHPVLKLDIGDVKGLWALKVRQRGYLQQARGSGGVQYFDLAALATTRGGPAAFIEVQAIGDLSEVTVREVALLREAPPSVTAETRYPDHYVRDSGSIEGLDLTREHPYVALSTAEIGHARSRGEAFEKWVAGFAARADKLCERDYKAPEQGYFYSMKFNCPTHGVPLSWRSAHPREHLCPVDKEIITGPEYDSEWRIQAARRAHDECRSALRGLGWAYALSGTEKYAEKARDIFVDYADEFPNYLWHTGRGQLTPEGSGMRVGYEPLAEAGWLADMAKSYDLVAASPVFSEEDRQAVEEMLREDVRVSLRYDERLSNRQCHHNLAVAAVGLCLRDETLVRRAVGSLRHQLKYAVLGDGFWWECSPGYHYYAMNTISELIQMLGRAGLDVAREPKFKLGYDGPLRFAFPDGNIPGVNDAGWRSAPPRGRYEYLYSVFEDPVHATLLDHQNRASSSEYLLHGRELGETAPLPTDSHLFFKAGMAMLKSGPERDSLCVALDWGQTVAGHGHADKLSTVVHGNGEFLGIDNGNRSYFSPVWRFWDRQTPAHNTVVVDERSQLHRKGRLELFDRQPAFSVCQATADEVYPGLRQRRTVFVTPDYAVDFFRVAKESTDLALRDEPINSIPYWRKDPWGCSSPNSLARDFARLERSTDARSGRFSAMLGQTENAFAGWGTDLRKVTGPNSEYRFGVMPVEAGAKCRFSAWVKTERATGTNRVRLDWLGEQARGLGHVALDVPNGTADWQELAQDVAAPAGAKFVGAQLTSDKNSGTVWFDDLSLTPADGGPNLLTRNSDFEATNAEVRSIDWTYHNLGALSCEVASAPAEFTMGRDVDEPHVDGENAYRYMRNLKAGDPAEATWQATWVTDAETGRGLELTMLGEPGTQVITADGQGPGTMTVPLVIARRRQGDTVFGAILEPIKAEARVRAVQRLRCTADGREVPSIEGYGIAVQMPDRTDYFLASYCPTEKTFGPITLTPGEGNHNCVAMVSISGDRPESMYLLGGKRLAWGLWSVEGPGVLQGEVLSQDEAARTITTDAALPPGDALNGAALVFDLPHNVCLSIDSVEVGQGGRVVSLAGIPNLWLTSGMRFSIPVPAFLSQRASGALFGAAPAGALIARPNGDGIRTIEYEDAEGNLQPLEFTRRNGCVVIRLTPQMMGDGQTYVVFDRPPGASLQDKEPPRIVSVLVNGEPLTAAQHVEVPFALREMTVEFEDAVPLRAEGVEVVVNGRPAAQDEFTVDKSGAGKKARVVVRPKDVAAIETVKVALADDSLLRNTARFSLRVVRAVEVIDLKHASGGKAVQITDPAGYLQATVDLAAGKYTANLISSGPSLGANSMWLDVDGERVDDPFHLPVEKLGNCSREVEMTDRLPRLSIARDGKHTLKFVLREGPGPVLDKLQIIKAGQVVTEAECEDMLP